MIEFEKYILDNGLKVIIHEDKSTPMVAVNVVYNVGSRDEDPTKTGFAHLFEHLMFGGSKHIPDYDEVIQNAGGENNAFTNTDLTNFYVTLPAQNIETAFWLESDRMKALTFSKKSLKTQQKVVIEEYKETCLNEPFGDMWHHMSGMAYRVHPYRWPTIGLDMSHISDATIDDVKKIFYKFYVPNNAAIILSGNVKSKDAMILIEKWFGDIAPGESYNRNLPNEPKQSAPRHHSIFNADLPHDASFIAYPTSPRLDKRYYAADLLSDVLANGRSSRFYQRLLKEQSLVSNIDAFISGTNDAGLFLIEAKMMPGVNHNQAYKAIQIELDIVKNELLSDIELTKLINNVESSIAYADTSILNKGLSLAYFEMLGDAKWINDESSKYQAITAHDIRDVAREIFDDNQVNILQYAHKDN